jgi:hypothetical protein
MQQSILKLINKNQALYTIGLQEDLTKEGFASFAAAGVYSVPVCDSKGDVVGMLDHVSWWHCFCSPCSFVSFVLKKKKKCRRTLLGLFCAFLLEATTLQNR